MKRQLFTLSTLTLLTLALTACGGGGGGSDATTATDGNTNTGGAITPTNTNSNTNNPSITLLKECTNTNNDQGFASAVDVTNKTLHKLTTDTKVNVWDLNDGTKKACRVSGSVEVL